MESILLYISSGIFLTVIAYIAIIIWDRNRIWTLLSNDISAYSKMPKRDRPMRRIFDGSNDD